VGSEETSAAADARRVAAATRERRGAERDAGVVLDSRVGPLRDARDARAGEERRRTVLIQKIRTRSIDAGAGSFS
jgi:hypothetical protein